MPDELHESDFVQLKVAPGKLLGQIDKRGPMMSRLRRLPQPSAAYLNDFGIRTIEVTLDENGYENWLWVHNADIERWVDDRAK